MATPNQKRSTWQSRFIEWIIYSRIGSRIANFPLVAFLLRELVRRQVRRDAVHTIANQPKRIAQENLQSTLEAVVFDVVETLDYVGAMVATYDSDGALPIKAWHFAFPKEQIYAWEAEIAASNPNRAVSLTNPESTRIYPGDSSHASNLGIQAYHVGHPVVNNSLLSLFQPVISDSVRLVIERIQKAMHVEQVIAVPFFIEASKSQKTGLAQSEFVGNLIALKRGPISQRDQQTLQAFGRQAASAILSERRRAYAELTLSLISDIQAYFQDENQILRKIVQGMVEHLDYAGAMVATCDSDDSLPIRAWRASVSDEQVYQWEAQIATVSPNRLITITNPKVARVYLSNPEYQKNLSVLAFQSRNIETSTDLYDLFRPVVPESSRPILAGIQAALGVQQVIAVPFFKQPDPEQTTEPEFVGNLFVLSRSSVIDDVERRVLQAFGQQAAAGIRNAQLYQEVQKFYQQAENRRRAATIFGKMAFNASASIHDLRNKIGVVRGFTQILPGIRDNYELSEPIFRNLDLISDALDNMHEPFRQVPDTIINVESCVRRAVSRIERPSNVAIKLHLDGNIPEIRAAQDMLIEVFKVLIKNAVEAVAENDREGMVSISSRMHSAALIEITIADTGVGIEPEHIGKIFELRWSTKNNGLGFGLFWSHDYITGIGGAIEVISTPGVGTTFFVRIPLKTTDDDEPIAQTP